MSQRASIAKTGGGELTKESSPLGGHQRLRFSQLSRGNCIQTVCKFVDSRIGNNVKAKMSVCPSLVRRMGIKLQLTMLRPNFRTAQGTV